MPKATRPATPKESSSEEVQPPAAPPTEPAPVSAGPVTVHVSPSGQVTISVQPAAPLPVSLLPPDVGLEVATEKGLNIFRREGEPEATAASPSAFEQVRDSLKTALDTMGKKFIEFASEVTTLEVKTYVSDRIEEVRPNDENGFENARQRALTVIQFDGDTQVVVPAEDGQIDQALWQIHLQTVEAAQAHRAAMLKTIGELVQGFIPKLK